MPDEFNQASGRLDNKLKSLQNRIEQLSVQFDLEKDGEEFCEYIQKEDFAKFNAVNMDKKNMSILSERVEPKTLDQISKLPDKIVEGEPPLSEKLFSFKSQQAYLESLNLREVCYNTFNTL